MKRKDNQRDGKYRTGVGYTVNTRHNRQGAGTADDANASTAGVTAKPWEQEQPEEPEEPEEPTVEPTLPFTLKNMIDLVIAYESYRKLEQSIMLLTDNFFPDNPILEGLRRIDEIMLYISPVFDFHSPASLVSPASGTIPAVPASDTVDDMDEDEDTDYDSADTVDSVDTVVEDFDYDMFSGILDNPMIGAKEKAEILMGMVPVDRATAPAV